MKKLIYYPPGCYGTFINWLCNINKPVTSTEDLPFAEFGNSHKYYSDTPYNHLFGSKHRNIFLKSPRDFGVLRTCWPHNVGVKLVNSSNLVDFYFQQCHEDLSKLAESCDKILVLHPTDQTKVWWYQNFCEKVTFSQDLINSTLSQYQQRYDNMLWLSTIDPVLRASRQLDLQKEQQNLAELFVKYNQTSALDFAPWQLRTALVEDLTSQTNNGFKFWNQLKDVFPKIKFVGLEDLRDNFQQTAKGIINYFDLNDRVIDNLQFIESEWLARQQHQSKDKLVNAIVDAIVADYNMDWSNQVNFFDEVYIEKILKDRGVSLLEVDVFPTTAQNFRKIFK